MAPLCKGSCHEVTEGLFCGIVVTIPPSFAVWQNPPPFTQGRLGIVQTVLKIQKRWCNYEKRNYQEKDKRNRY